MEVVPFYAPGYTLVQSLGAPMLIRVRYALLPALAAAILVISAAGSLLYVADAKNVQERWLGDAMSQNDLRAKQLASSVARQVDALIRLFDVASIQLCDAYGGGGAKFENVADSVLKSFPEGSVHLVTVIGSDGRVAYSSDAAGVGVDLSDRRHFRFHADGGADRLFVGAPFRGRLISNEWLIPLSRAIRKGGRFMGVVSITVYPEYLGAALASLSLNPGDIAALIQNDGTFLARSQKIDEALGHKVPPDRPFLNGSQSDANTFRALSQFTQKPLVYSWRRLADWGLIATVGLDESAELSPVREAIAASGLRNWIAVTVAMGFSLAIAGLLLWAQRQKRELATSDERFALAVRGSNDGIWDCDLRQNTMFFSAQWKRQLGYEDDELENAFSTFESLMHSQGCSVLPA